MQVWPTGVKCCGESLTNQARFPHPLGRTVTLVAIHQVLAGAPVVAGVWRAVVNIWTEGIQPPVNPQSLLGARCAHASSVRLLMVQEGPLQPGAH